MERKLATVLFVDLVGSTALVRSADPEVVRRRVTRFFDEVSACVEAHGGVVEKFAGDAVLAAFGVPQAHEDDAERAIKAGFAILDQVRELGLEARVGIESGEVVVDTTDSTFVTGSAVNLAARLQQQAGPGEVLIGPTARGLTDGVIETEEVGLIELKGLSPVTVWHALCADGSRGLSSVRAPLIGREAELELLSNNHARTIRDRRAHLFTIYGEAGVGKSRVAREFVDGVEGATVLTGRCLPYGEGITYWPLAEMVKTVAGISDDDPIEEAFEKLRDCCEDEAVADLLGLASGVLEALEGDLSPQEIAWAARAFVERLSEAQPVVLYFEDIHWAEEPLLELIEHLADWVRGPLLILCLARTELLEVHSGWGGGRLRVTAIELEPLSAAESGQLVEALLADEHGSLAPDVLRALLDKTEGNPLFVEETVRMVLERGPTRGVERIPDTVQALIGARIDRLHPVQRSLLRRAAVIGRVFWRGSLAHLSPDVEDLDAALADLLLREFLLQEPRSSITGETAYRFKHVLIREVAYAGLSKSARADHHAGFAAWLKERAGDELIEIRAYHLDHAATLLAELDGAAPAELGDEAAEALYAAGRRALAREANRSARKLLVRAAQFRPSLEYRYRAAIAAWRLDDLPAVSAEMENVAEEAAEAGEKLIHGQALTALAQVALLREADALRAKELAEQALGVLDGDARFTALLARSDIGWLLGDLADAEQYALEALEVARLSEHKHRESVATQELARIYRVRLEDDRAEPLIMRALELAEESGGIVARASALLSRGEIQLHRGAIDEAAACFEEARSLFSEAGAAWMMARTLNSLGRVAGVKGDLAAAERHFREAIRVLKPLEDRGTLCESQRGLAEVLVARAKVDDAERHALEARETVGPHDAGSLATTTMTLGIVRAAQGRDDEAEKLLRSAQEALAASDFREFELEALEALVQFFRDREREDEAVVFERRLLELAPVAAIGSAFSARAARIA
jgi:class 3 adenylate cyclase/tetratricopeptide (TPR) repeat protein